MWDLLLAQAVAVDAPSEISAEATAPLPEGVRRMISAAMRMDEGAQLDAVVATAKRAYPEHAGSIDALVVRLQTPVAPLMIEPLIVPAPVPVEFEEPGYWEDFHAELALSAAETRGNSDTLFLGLDGKLNLMRKAQIHRLEAYANTAEANGVESQNNWGLSYQLDTLWTDEYFGYVRGSVDRDDFAGFQTAAFAGIGAGMYVVQSDPVTLRSEVGPGYRYLEFADEDRTIGAVGLYGSAELDWLITEDWAFELDTTVTISGPTSTFHPTASINAVVSDRVRAGASYDLRYESNPPLMSEELDRILKFNVTYSY